MRSERVSNEALSRDDVIGIMVGDLQRIRIYPAKGFQIPQDIPRTMSGKRSRSSFRRDTTGTLFRQLSSSTWDFRLTIGDFGLR